MVPMLAMTSSRDMPMPLSVTVTVRAFGSKATRIFNSASFSISALVGKRFETQLVRRIRGIGNQLAQKNLLVAIQGVNHQVEQLFDFGLEAVGFLGVSVVIKFSEKARGASDAHRLSCVVE